MLTLGGFYEANGPQALPILETQLQQDFNTAYQFLVLPADGFRLSLRRLAQEFFNLITPAAETQIELNLTCLNATHEEGSTFLDVWLPAINLEHLGQGHQPGWARVPLYPPYLTDALDEIQDEIPPDLAGQIEDSRDRYDTNDFNAAPRDTQFRITIHTYRSPQLQQNLGNLAKNIQIALHEISAHAFPFYRMIDHFRNHNEDFLDALNRLKTGEQQHDDLYHCFTNLNNSNHYYRTCRDRFITETPPNTNILGVDSANYRTAFANYQQADQARCLGFHNAYHELMEQLSQDLNPQHENLI